MMIRTSRKSTLLFLFGALLLLFILAIGVGQVSIPPGETIRIIAHHLGWLKSYQPNPVFETVLWNIRAPRLLMTILIGAALAISGASLQGLFRNPLVEPGLIGVSSGAAMSVVLLVVFGSTVALGRESLQMALLIPLCAFIGGFAATMLVLKMSHRLGRTSTAVLILSGVAVNALSGAVMGLAIFYADENQLRMFTFWTLGDLGGATWPRLAIATPLLVIAIISLLRYQRQLNAIALGESNAFHLGVDVERVKRSVVLFSALAVGISVSLSGIIGFIGLVIPHLVRIFFQADNRIILPASVIAGPLLLIAADLAARTLVSPSELPIGVVTAFVGAPFFIFLLLRSLGSAS